MHESGSLMGKSQKKPCCKGRSKSGPWMDGTLQTEYRKEYYEKDGPPQERVRQPFVFRGALRPGEGPLAQDTTYGTTYRGYDGQPRTQPFRPQPSPKEDHTFASYTTYKEDFPAKGVPYVRIRPSHALQASAGPFEDATTSKTHFPDWGVVAPATPAPQGRATNIPASRGPFEGLSSYKSDYPRWPASHASPAAPQRGANAALPQGAFDPTTSYSQDYASKQARPAEPHRPENSMMVSAGWFDGLAPGTEYRGQYEQKDGRPASRAGGTTAASGKVLQSGPFDGSTTYGATFRPRTAPQYVRAPKPQDLPRDAAAVFAGQSTYAADFLRKAAPPYQLVRPGQEYRPSSGRFDDSTTHKAVYRDPGPVAVYRGGPQRQTLEKDNGPFAGTTTYNNDFTKWPGGVRASLEKPGGGSRSLHGQGPFDGTTTYSLDYVPKYGAPAKSMNPNYCESCDPASDCDDTL